MKKLIFTLALISTCCLSLHAKKGYEGSIDIGHSVGIGDVNNSITSLNFINGNRFNPYFFIGIGVGLGYTNAVDVAVIDRFITFDNLGSYSVSLNWGQGDRRTAYLVPVFLSLKANINDNKVSPFLSLNTGYTFLINRKGRETPGFMAQTNFGVDFKFNEKQAMYFLIGLNFQNFHYTKTAMGLSGGYGSYYIIRHTFYVFEESGMLKSIDFRVGLKF